MTLYCCQDVWGGGETGLWGGGGGISQIPPPPLYETLLTYTVSPSRRMKQKEVKALL